MTRRCRELLLGAYLSYGAGHHAAAWRHPISDPHAVRSIDHFISMARMAEEHLFDLIFLSDAPAVFNDDQVGFGGRVTSFEPLTLASAMANATEHIGLVVTASSTYNEPYNVARQFASLDHISCGRAGWNMVTTSKLAAAGNFGLPFHPRHADRYARAEEFINVVQALWDTWEADAYPANKVTGLYYDTTKRHRVSFSGEHISIDGELNVPRPIQGYPLLVQAGSSEVGRDLAARTADLVFTAQPDIRRSLEFISDLDARRSLLGSGRAPLVVMPGLTVYCGSTRQEAEEKLNRLQELIEPEFGLAMLGDLLGGFNLVGVDVDGPLPILPPSNMNTSRRALIEHLAYDRGFTVRLIYETLTVSRGHLTIIGSYDEVADELMSYFDSGAVNGFNFMPPLAPSSLEEFAQNIIPRLQDRGVFKRRYNPGTLRQKLGLRHPENQFALSRISPVNGRVSMGDESVSEH